MANFGSFFPLESPLNPDKIRISEKWEFKLCFVVCRRKFCYRARFYARFSVTFGHVCKNFNKTINEILHTLHNFLHMLIST